MEMCQLLCQLLCQRQPPKPAALWLRGCSMSMSLGCQGSDSTIESAVKAAITAGIVVVVAACNG